MHNPFTAHPRSVNESYFEHLKYASRSGLIMIIAGIVSIIHGLLPFLFKTTGSDFLINLIKKHVQRTPLIDSRIIHLSECIDIKLRNKRKAS